MTPTQWRIRKIIEHLGWRGVSGLSLLVTSVALIGGVLLPMNMHIADLRADLFSPGRQHDSAHEVRAVRAPDSAAELDAFYQSFPTEETLANLLARLHRIGAKHGVAMRQADYRAVEERGARLGQYRIVVPATATYPRLKQFLAETLAQMPSLSLDQINLQRRAVADSQVDVQLQFTLYLRPSTRT
jgi:Type II secretion system (T2SS), protein M subtype b